MRNWVSRILVALLLVPGLGVLALDSAFAGECRLAPVPVLTANGESATYKVTKVDCAAGVTPGAQPVVVKGAPSCDIKSASPATFCVGSLPCFTKDSVVPWVHPATKPPTPDSKYSVQLCFTNNSWLGTAVWNGPATQPPSMAVQATSAVGRIHLPSAVLSFNPTARTLVNLPTWFWAQGLTSEVLRGSSALGLVAYATPARLEVTPGDGSAVLRCPWVTVRPQVPADQSGPCSYAYFRSSIGGSARGPDGGPAYEASAQAFWSLRFELNGAPVQIAGAPSELPGPVMTTAVEVGEVQTLVTSAG
jgi:hypothetical protein